MITAQQFQWIVDRLAAQYAALATAIQALSPAPTRATLATGNVGANNALTWTAVTPGGLGNTVTVALVVSGTSTPLSVAASGTAVTVNVATNGGGSPTSTAIQVAAAITGSVAASGLVTVAGTTGSSGAGVVAAVAATALSGALYGTLAPQLVQTGDATLLGAAETAALALDQGVTTDGLIDGVGVWGSFVNTLRAYLARVGQTGLVDGYLSANSLRVHEGFDQLHWLATRTRLSGANVFAGVSQPVGVVTLSGGGYATVTLRPTGAFATVTVTGGANTGITWTAANVGPGGNAITITYANPGAASRPLGVVVEGHAVTVNLATDSGSLVTSTAAQVITAVAASTAAAALLAGANAGSSTGAGVVGAVGPVSLSNRDTAVAWTAVTPGGYGNTVTIAYVVAGTGTSLTVGVSGTAVTVNVATDGSGNPTSTASQVVAAVAASAAAALLTGSTTATQVVSAVSATPLQGGAVPAVGSLAPLGTGSGATSTTNRAAQALQVAVTPAVGSASWVLYPSGATAFATITTPTANTAITWTAANSGTVGNAVTIRYVVTQVPSTSLTVGVSGTAVTVNLATNAGGTSTSTAAQVIAAVAANGSAAALLTGANAGGSSGAGVIGVAVGPVGLTNTRTKVLYTAVTPGPGGNSITVAYVVSGTNTALSVGVSSTAVTVNVATNGSGNPTSTASQVVTAVQGSGAAAALVTPSIPTGGQGDGIVAAVPATPLYGGNGPNLTRATDLLVTLLRSDLGSVTRAVSFAGSATPGTTVTLGAIPATLTVGQVSANTAVLYTAATPGVVGNSITVAYVDPGAPGVGLSVGVSVNAITVTLATTPLGVVYSTADEVAAAVQGSGAAAALVTASISGWGFGRVQPQAATNLLGGSGAERYYGITGATVTRGGEPGDTFTVSSVVERSVHL
jgi:hypothetical protein